MCNDVATQIMQFMKSLTVPWTPLISKLPVARGWHWKKVLAVMPCYGFCIWVSKETDTSKWALCFYGHLVDHYDYIAFNEILF